MRSAAFRFLELINIFCISNHKLHGTGTILLYSRLSDLTDGKGRHESSGLLEPQGFFRPYGCSLQLCASIV